MVLQNHGAAGVQGSIWVTWPFLEKFQNEDKEFNSPVIHNTVRPGSLNLGAVML